MQTLVVIPARGGLKGIRRKNIKDFGGHPLIAYSIASALASSVHRVKVLLASPYKRYKAR